MATLASRSHINILIACEYSGIIRSAFQAMGYNAWSCDILKTEIPGQHYQGNVHKIINRQWHLLIAHPPCRYLSSAGLHLCNIESHGIKAFYRIKERNKAVDFFFSLYFSNIPHICIENPIGHISSTILKPTQIIHPYYFGDNDMKRTALWLKNLPPLTYSQQANLFSDQTTLPKPTPIHSQISKSTGRIKYRHFTDSFINNRLKNSKERSKSFPGIASAMADQWSPILDQYINA